MRWMSRSISSGTLPTWLAFLSALLGGLEGRAPDRLPLHFVEVGEILGEADDEVHLGEHRVDRKIDLQHLMQLIEALADGVGVRRRLIRMKIDDVGDADGDDARR